MSTLLTRRQLLGGVGGAAGATLGTVPTGAKPTSDDRVDVPERGLLFDGDRTIVREGAISGRPCALVAYENAIDSASGIDVFSDDGLVTDRTEVDGIIRALSWQSAFADLPSDLVSSLESLESTSETISTALSPVLSALGEIHDVIETLRDRGLWQVATAASPSLGTFADTVEALRSLTDAWVTASESVDETTPPLVEVVEEIQQAAPDYGELPASFYGTVDGRFEASGSALSSLATESDRLVDRADGVVGTARDIAGALETVDDIGDPLVAPFESLGDALEDVTDPLRDFEARLDRLQNSVGGLRSEITRQRRDHTDQWERRQAGPTRVYSLVSLGFFGLFIVATDLLAGPLAITEEDQQ